MNAFLFGESSRALFGFYHDANLNKEKQQVIVMCAPIGHEYTRSHNTLKQLALRLSQAGYAVLRFNYYATGDSAGDESQADLNQWNKDILSAIQEAKDISGYNKVTLLGLRLGALLALEASQHVKIDHLLLWDPVLEGSKFIQDIDEMHEFMLNDPERFYLTENSISETKNEFLGHAYSDQLLTDLNGLSYEQGKNYQCKMVCCVSSNELNSDWKSFLTGHLNAHLFSVDSSTNWNDSRQIGRMFIASDALNQITQIFEGC